MRLYKSRRTEKRRPESRCPDCANVIFDETWGEYKCKVLKRRIRKPDEHTSCKDFKKAD